jgi:hypothetical protein
MTIAAPQEVDSLGKLREWLAECGMKEFDPAEFPTIDHAKIEHETWGFGFKFKPDDPHAADVGYAHLIRHAASCFYGRFERELSEHPQTRIIWRERPRLVEEARMMKRVLADGTDWHSDDDDDDEFPEGSYLVDAGFSAGKFFCRLIFVRIY